MKKPRYNLSDYNPFSQTDTSKDGHEHRQSFIMWLYVTYEKNIN
jgi:hypothetical protein